jgi:hypothetical protein
MINDKYLLNQFEKTIAENSEHYHGSNIAQGYVKKNGDFIYIYHVYNQENGTYEHHEMTAKGYMLFENSLDWYVVTYTNNKHELKHAQYLSNILQCGHDKADYNILKLEQCYQGCENCLTEDHFY